MCLSRCRPGFIGPLCQFLDPCHRSPCLNGAACKSQVVNGLPQYSCVCQRGFRGTVHLSEFVLIIKIFIISDNKNYESTYVNWIFNLQAKTAATSMPVPRAPVPTGPVVPTGITTTTVPAHLASRERTAAMTLMSAASLACASTVASASIPKGRSAVSANLDTVGARVRCPPCPVPHLSALTGAPVDKPATTLMSVLAYQVE